MDSTNNCYDTIAYTDKNGYTDSDLPRLHEYEFRHPYSAGADFQPHKMTLIVKNGEARVLYKSPDIMAYEGVNGMRQGNRIQAAMTFDLGSNYRGGRIGAFTYAHQMEITSFIVTDISDDSNLPTAYCGGDKGTMCDVGVTGLCLGVAAAGVCEGSTTGQLIDTTNLDTFEFIQDPVSLFFFYFFIFYFLVPRLRLRLDHRSPWQRRPSIERQPHRQRWDTFRMQCVD